MNYKLVNGVLMILVIVLTSIIICPLFRYHFFLQVKKDILEGKLVVPYKTAGLLASYAVQCKYKQWIVKVENVSCSLGSIIRQL